MDVCIAMHFLIVRLHTYTIGHRCRRIYIKDRAGARICKADVNTQTKGIHCIGRFL